MIKYSKLICLTTNNAVALDNSSCLDILELFNRTTKYKTHGGKIKMLTSLYTLS